MRLSLSRNFDFSEHPDLYVLFGRSNNILQINPVCIQMGGRIPTGKKSTKWCRFTSSMR